MALRNPFSDKFVLFKVSKHNKDLKDKDIDAINLFLTSSFHMEFVTLSLENLGKGI